MTRSRLTFLAILSFLLGEVGSIPPARADDEKPILRLRAFTVDLSGTRRARTGTLDIVIERWSTPAELAMLRDVLVEKGEDKLLSTLQKIKPRAGYIRTSTSLGWDIHIAQQTLGSDGRRRISLATDRPMSFWEAVQRPRSADYQFTLAEIRLRPDGKGEGKLVPAAKIDYDKETNTLEIENYDIEPVRLTEVTVEK
jgi:hypothetical protein